MGDATVVEGVPGIALAGSLMTDDLDARRLHITHAPLEAVNQEDPSSQPLIGFHGCDLGGRSDRAFMLLTFHIPLADEYIQASKFRAWFRRLLRSLGSFARCHNDFSFENWCGALP